MAVVDGSLRSRTRHRPAAVLHGAAAVAVTSGCLVSVWFWLSSTATAERSLDQSARVAVLLLGAGALSLLWRRRAPVVVLGATGLALLGYELVSSVNTPLPLALLIALCAFAGACRPTLAIGSALAIGIFVVVGAVFNEVMGDVFVDYVLLVVVAWTLGSATRVASARTAALGQQAAAALREQETRTALAVQEERARIARDLHDVVAHHVSVVVAQARAGQAVFERDPTAARDMLRSVEDAGRAALMEMQCLLGLLRPAEEDPAVAPQPTLDQLPALLAQLRAAEMPVTLDVGGDVRRLPAFLQLTAYRIVQESLTNALKHGRRGQTHVAVVLGPRSLDLQIDDVGQLDRSLQPTVGGRGLIGMQQRVLMVGGTLEAGPRPDGGFRVTASLPTTPTLPAA